MTDNINDEFMELDRKLDNVESKINNLNVSQQAFNNNLDNVAQEANSLSNEPIFNDITIQTNTENINDENTLLNQINDNLNNISNNISYNIPNKKNTLVIDSIIIFWILLILIFNAYLVWSSP